MNTLALGSIPQVLKILFSGQLLYLAREDSVHGSVTGHSLWTTVLSASFLAPGGPWNGLLCLVLPLLALGVIVRWMPRSLGRGDGPLLLALLWTMGPGSYVDFATMTLVFALVMYHWGPGRRGRLPAFPPLGFAWLWIHWRALW